jgi:hypothetical protein
MISERKGTIEDAQDFLSQLTLKPEIEGVLVTTQKGHFIASSYDSIEASRHSKALRHFMDSAINFVQAIGPLGSLSLIRFDGQERKISISVSETFLMTTISKKSSPVPDRLEEENKELGQSN